MGITSYKNIEELIDELTINVKKLSAGKLSIEEIESIVEQSKELYERLVVLRYKAYESFGSPQNQDDSEKDIEDEVKESTSFDFTNITVDQPEEKEGDDQPGFDFTESENEDNETDNSLDEIHEEEETSGAKENPDSDEEESLYEKFKKQDDDDTLRKKLQNSPVRDIKSEISLARRFEYISLLFGNDSEAYDKAIEKFNNCSTGEEAKTMLNDYSSSNDWNLEDKVIIKFVELVERRYL